CTPHCHPTRPNVRGGGAPALNLPIPEEREPGTTHPFKGNMDVAALRRVLSEQRERVPLVMITVTNNSGGGQPVSMANLREVSAACREFGVPLIMDCCRYAENAYFIKLREAGYENSTPREIAQEMFSYVDGATMSA